MKPLKLILMPLQLLVILTMGGCSDEVKNPCTDAASDLMYKRSLPARWAIGENQLLYDEVNGTAYYTATYRIENICGGSEVAFDFYSMLDANSKLYINVYVDQKLIKLNNKIVREKNKNWRVDLGYFSYETEGSGTLASLEFTIKIRFYSTGMRIYDDERLIDGFNYFEFSAEYKKL